MPRNCLTRILVICDPGYDVQHIQTSVLHSSQEMQLTRVSIPPDIHELPINNADIAFLELGALRRRGIDPSDLGDTLYSHIPVIFLGTEQEGQLALAGIRAGAQDWLLHEQLRSSPIAPFVENAQREYAHHRNLVVNHAKYQSVVEDQSEIIFRCKPDFTVIFVNKACVNHTGVSLSALEGNCLSNIKNLRDFVSYKRKIEHFSPQLSSAHHEECSHVNGDSFWHSWTDKAIFDSNGEILEIQSTGTDITVRRCAEQEAIDGKKRFKSLYDNAPVMMQELDSKGRILSVNRCWLEVMEQRLQNVIGFHAFRFLDKNSRQPVMSAVDELNRSGRVRNIQCRYKRAIHSPINVIASATTDLWDENQETRILVVSTEIDRPFGHNGRHKQRHKQGGIRASRGSSEKPILRH